MPILLTKIEGKGNGIKTVIPNMSDVSRALSRPPTYPTKFFGCELGAQTTFDEKNDRYIVNGAHDATRLRELLDVFIDKFVLCKSCKNPETDLVIVKGDNILRNCKACGEHTGVDMRHKLTTFIVKNPPPKTKKGKKGHADAGGGEANPVNQGGENGDAGSGAESDDELTKKIKAEAADLNQDTELAKEDWSQDTSAEAVAARVKALEGTLATTVIGGEDDVGSDGDDVDSPYAQLGRWVEDNRAIETSVNIYIKAQELGIEKKHKTVLVLVQALFTDDIVEEIPKFAALLAKVCFAAGYIIFHAYRHISRWLLRKSIKSLSLAGSSVSSAMPTPTSSPSSQKSSWRYTKRMSLRKMSLPSGAHTSARSMSTRILRSVSGRRANRS